MSTEAIELGQGTGKTAARGMDPTSPARRPADSLGALLLQFLDLFAGRRPHFLGLYIDHGVGLVDRERIVGRIPDFAYIGWHLELVAAAPERALAAASVDGCPFERLDDGLGMDRTGFLRAL